jgi:hypothetical protein
MPQPSASQIPRDDRVRKMSMRGGPIVATASSRRRLKSRWEGWEAEARGVRAGMGLLGLHQGPVFAGARSADLRSSRTRRRAKGENWCREQEVLEVLEVVVGFRFVANQSAAQSQSLRI